MKTTYGCRIRLQCRVSCWWNWVALKYTVHLAIGRLTVPTSQSLKNEGGTCRTTKYNIQYRLYE